MPEHLTKGTGFGSGAAEQIKPRAYPTPRCFMHKDALRDRGKSNLGEVINEMEQVTKTGQLNPSWVELLMGWPKDWTCLKRLSKLSFNRWLMGFRQEKNNETETPSYGREAWKNGTWETATPKVEPDVADRVDRLKAIGNGQVPAVIQLASGSLSLHPRSVKG